MEKEISRATLKRLPTYLAYLKAMPDSSGVNISATALAAGLHMGEVQVRKDLALVSSGGRPKIGYNRAALIADIEQFLGYGNTNDAVLIGAGKLGRALLGYSGFAEYGLNIVAAFDENDAIIGTSKSGKPIMHLSRLGEVCRRDQIKIGIITVPAEQAQSVCDLLISNGILAIWNFAPKHLNVPDHILVQNENMAASLALLCKHLNEQMKSEKCFVLNFRVPCCIITQQCRCVGMVDEADSKSVGVTLVWVRVPPPAPLRNDLCMSDDRASAFISTAKVFLRSNPQSLRWIAGLYCKFSS